VRIAMRMPGHNTRSVFCGVGASESRFSVPGVRDALRTVHLQAARVWPIRRDPWRIEHVTNETSSPTRTPPPLAAVSSLGNRSPAQFVHCALPRPQRPRQTVRLPVSTRCGLTAVGPHDRLRSSHTPTRQLRPFAPASITIVLCLRRSV
jgi:hypothetical protein